MTARFLLLGLVLSFSSMTVRADGHHADHRVPGLIDENSIAADTRDATRFPVLDDKSACPTCPPIVGIKTATETFTHHWMMAIRDGRIWVKPNPAWQHRKGFWQDVGVLGAADDAIQADWQLMLGTGLPHKVDDFEAPVGVREITADGENLIAVGTDHLVYYWKFNEVFKRNWKNWWGLPFVTKELFSCRDEGWRNLAMSHRGPLTGGYNDIGHYWHPIGPGVTTLYKLSLDGLKLSYADPWLRPNFNLEVCMPEKNTFRAKSMSASASTIFVMDSKRRSYARLVDFDTGGDDAVFSMLGFYTYDKAEMTPGTKVRLLPAEDWTPQRPLPADAQVTHRTTIAQFESLGPITGNAARELRVEGIKDGKGGYYSKYIRTIWDAAEDEAEWEWVADGHYVREADLLKDDEGPGPEISADYEGVFRGAGVDGEDVPVRMIGYNLHCNATNPYTIVKYWIGGRWIDNELLTRRVVHSRAPKVDAQGKTVQDADGNDVEVIARSWSRGVLMNKWRLTSTGNKTAIKIAEDHFGRDNKIPWVVVMTQGDRVVLTNDTFNNKMGSVEIVFNKLPRRLTADEINAPPAVR